MNRLFCFGLGYSASFIARGLADEGWSVAGTARTREGADAIAAQSYDAIVFDGTQPCPEVQRALARATHVLVSIPPDAGGDPVLRHYADDLERSKALSWIGYLSTVGVYGDSQGAWIDETAPADATSVRGQRRIAAEQAWLALAERRGVRAQVFRLAGIYGPGRSAIDRLREGTAHRIVKPGHVFNRIHVDDIAQAVCAGIAGRGGEQIYNVADDEPAPPQDVIVYAAQLLHMPPPPAVPFEDAELTPMAASFYAANKRISNARLRQELGVALKFPTYREGLRAILAHASQD
ncbi:MAG: SDR family oxidoreductase [Hyphomicrobium sp.]|uniref:SDR family oxidoreductase n=1 Tax=Hyphomicrobium sp. TaxID=82 RepID=UPI00132C3F2B|nr:SDR family oxidoreductase [Hyphomicrobium sp.]KAB2942527.1 MAG: SDR family oxidoreductase [Hyphomicrobium sp.]MBZ0208496.1 SDR family oxidoreductase [Hyphomicrobium sp.]MCZ7594678.1 SDR family oxidoreductase [Hyphomicrobium sp.]